MKYEATFLGQAQFNRLTQIMTGLGHVSPVPDRITGGEAAGGYGANLMGLYPTMPVREKEALLAWAVHATRGDIAVMFAAGLKDPADFVASAEEEGWI